MLTSEEVMEILSVDDILRLMHDLGADPLPNCDRQGNYIFPTICHHENAEDGSYKLYFFPDSKLFYCYTHCGSLDIFEIVRRRKGLEDFYSAFLYVLQYFHLQNAGFELPQKTEDWDVLSRIKTLQKRNELLNLKKEHHYINPNLLEYYCNDLFPQEWIDEGITTDVMSYYNIRVDPATHNIIIPHYDIEGHLVGLRRRTYDLQEIDRGKYSPVFLEGDMYNHPLGDHLYGLFQNKETIKKGKRVIIFEAEKSVLQLASFFGVEECYGVATCGSSLSNNQIKLLLQLGVEEVILAYDREFDGGRGDPDTVEYENKLSKIMKGLTPYVDVYVIMDYDHLTNKKDSPTDQGKEIFEKLLDAKIYVPSIRGE